MTVEERQGIDVQKSFWNILPNGQTLWNEDKKGMKHIWLMPKHWTQMDSSTRAVA